MCELSFDSDGPFSYVWQVNSSQVAATGATLSSDNFVKGNIVSCEVSDDSQTGSDQIVISNSPPVVSNWIIAMTRGQDLTCRAYAFDGEEFGTCGPDFGTGAECTVPFELLEQLPTVTIVEPE
jgi:hypothetical protein